MTAVAPAFALASNGVISHDSAVSPTPNRRRFTAAYKMKILEQIDRCNQHGEKRGEIGALLRREGLYSSQLAAWRRAREQGDLATRAALVQRRGPKSKPMDPSAKRIVDLERELARAVKRAERAEALVEVQKKVSALLNQIDRVQAAQESPGSSPDDSASSDDAHSRPR
jgi:transposase